jgi:hypothetical protein
MELEDWVGLVVLILLPT